MAELAPDTALAAEFLKRWGTGPWPLCAFHEQSSNNAFKTFTSKNIGDLPAWIEQQNAAERNVYFHVNTVSPPKYGKAEKTDVVRMEWLHVDVDPRKGKDIKAEQQRILAELQKNDLLPPASVITFSGGGYQAFWRLAEPIELNGHLPNVEDAESYNVQIAALLGGDNCYNADRIMRLPGTINHPNAKKRENGQVPVMAQVIRDNWDVAYPIEKFVKAVTRNDGGLPGSKNQVEVKVSSNIPRIAQDALENDPVLSKIEDRAKVAIVQGHDPEQPLTGGNSRSDWVWYVTNAMVRAKLDDDTMYSILTDPDLGISAHIRAQGNGKAVHRAAMRSIQRAKEHEIDPWLASLNGEYAFIESVGGKARIACETYNEATGRVEIEFHLVDGFKQMNQNKFIEMPKHDNNGKLVGMTQIPVGKWWLTHPNRREYRRVVFYPNRDFPDSMNLWRGFAVNAVPGNCSLFLDHIRDVLCGGNKRYYAYMLGWMANAVQNPHLPGQVAIVMRGSQGTGKGTFAKLFGRLFGVHYKYVSNPEHVTGTFNAMLADAVVVFADECFAANDKAAESALKSLITEETLRVTPKGVDNMEARNCVHLLMATNSDWAISADMDDRRFFVIEMDDSRRVDTDYFGAMRRQMEAGGYEALLHFLMTYDLTGFDPFNCPKTAELRKQQDQSLGEMPSFLLHCLEDGVLLPSHSGWRRYVLKEALVERFKADYPRCQKASNRTLGIFLTKYGVRSETGSKPETWVDSSGRKRESSSRPKIWAFPSLSVMRKEWERVSNSGPRNWPEAEEEDIPTTDDGGDAF